ncbi:hypothetical protein E1B28_013032 [Marasmius oreades]|uniref:Uncharacterized protein n=1 Tax=Marasmius oreades TaxID=181124 RepID=A0A9P7RPM8_9AGAR|nr:uncharacterized protein E1B28_013032 [Marasmius oreades]KAG7087053.1 hypothetical protein E1B28_013032 [Marasmius oreades]
MNSSNPPSPNAGLIVGICLAIVSVISLVVLVAVYISRVNRGIRRSYSALESRPMRSTNGRCSTMARTFKYAETRSQKSPSFIGRVFLAFRTLTTQTKTATRTGPSYHPPTSSFLQLHSSQTPEVPEQVSPVSDELPFKPSPRLLSIPLPPYPTPVPVLAVNSSAGADSDVMRTPRFPPLTIPFDAPSQPISQSESERIRSELHTAIGPNPFADPDPTRKPTSTQPMPFATPFDHISQSEPPYTTIPNPFAKPDTPISPTSSTLLTPTSPTVGKGKVITGGLEVLRQLDTKTALVAETHASGMGKQAQVEWV